jgi:hypothetical protein
LFVLKVFNPSGKLVEVDTRLLQPVVPPCEAVMGLNLLLYPRYSGDEEGSRSFQPGLFTIGKAWIIGSNAEDGILGD